MSFFRRALLCLGITLLTLPVCGQGLAEDGSAARDWSYLTELYLWGPNVDLETADGSRTEIEFSDLAKITEMGGMGGFYARRNKWRFGIDVIYMDVEDKVNAPVAPGLELQKAGLELFYANPIVSYDIARFDRSEFSVYAGARYLWAKFKTKVRTAAPLPVGSFRASESDDRWDAIIGLHGSTNLTERWYVNYQADVGAGQSDSVFQFVGDVNYRFRKLDASLGYRYLRYDPDGDLFNEFEFKGFFAGAKLYF